MSVPLRTTVDYVEDVSPGSGTLPPRAWYASSDATSLSLNGDWLFRPSPAAGAADDSFAREGFDADGWARIAVPGHWVLQGHGSPVYTNHRYPFPVDPPRVPTENPTGDHLRVFDLPPDWPDRSDGEAVLRFEGVESCARVWLNGIDRVRWFGGGPGEAYPDTRMAAAVGRWQSTVDGMQTPYVRPQENGARIDVRWAELGGLRVEGEPLFLLTTRRWTTEQLDAAAHRTDLVPGDTVWVNLDHAQHGIGSQSCGPGPLPRHHLRPEPAEFSFVFSPLPSRSPGV
ncbi:beta-galactosidase small subunit-related protein [Streptomyces sp. CPS1]